MKALKIAGIVVLVYVGIVVAFESLIGVFQPSNQTTLVITTRDADGSSHQRVVSQLESSGHVYVAANHWPRAWYRRALENPDVEATIRGETADYTAVPVTGDERQQVDSTNGLPLFFRFLTGFPPREFLRLDPKS